MLASGAPLRGGGVLTEGLVERLVPREMEIRVCRIGVSVLGSKSAISSVYLFEIGQGEGY